MIARSAARMLVVACRKDEAAAGNRPAISCISISAERSFSTASLSADRGPPASSPPAWGDGGEEGPAPARTDGPAGGAGLADGDWTGDTKPLHRNPNLRSECRRRALGFPGAASGDESRPLPFLVAPAAAAVGNLGEFVQHAIGLPFSGVCPDYSGRASSEKVLKNAKSPQSTTSPENGWLRALCVSARIKSEAP